MTRELKRWAMRVGSLGLLLGAILPMAAHASDGLIEISHAGAIAGGITSGDTPGYPITLSVSGSYVLTSDLAVPSATHGLILTTSEIAIDLNGFTIRGPGTCASAAGASSIICTETTTNHGIHGGGRTNVDVRNGTVRGFGGIGVYVGEECRLRDLTALENRGGGIVAGNTCVVHQVVARRNGQDGINCGAACSISDATAFFNRTNGVEAGNGSTIETVSSFDNGSNGFQLLFGCTMRGGSAYLNEGNGYAVRGGTLVESSTAYANAGNQIDSINDNCSYRANNLYQGSGAGYVNGCVNAGQNTCGSGPCP